MNYPTRFILNSDYASIPAPLLPPVKLSVTAPTGMAIPNFAMNTVDTFAYLDGDFDFLNWEISCDQYPQMSVHNGILRVDTPEFGSVIATVDPLENGTVRFRAYTSGSGTTQRYLTHDYTFRATVMPMRSPFAR